MKAKKHITVNSCLNKPFYKFKPLGTGISLDCKRQQIKSCHYQCIYRTIPRVKVHLHNPWTR